MSKQSVFDDFATLISHLPGHFYWKDSQGYYVGCNASALKILGLESKKMIGKTDYQLWPNQAVVLKEYDEQVITRRQSLTVEETITLGSGEEKILNVTRAPIFDEHNKQIVGIIFNIVDITKQKRKEMRLKQDIKALEFKLKKAEEKNLELNRKTIHKVQKISNAPVTKNQSKTISNKKKEFLSNSYPLTYESSHILIVEDHPITAKITQDILADLNCQVDIAMNGETALEQVKNQSYDLILMDIGLPDIDGCEVTKQIRLFEDSSSLKHHVPIIGLTARIDSKSKQHCIDVGMNAVFSKPLMKEKVQDIFKTFVSLDVIETMDIEGSLLEFDDMGKEKVIDLELGAHLIGGDERSAREAIAMMIHSFPEELMKLDRAYQAVDWQTVQDIVHKLRGGTSYCGTPRLKEACVRLDEYLKQNKREHVGVLYHRLIVEIDVLKEQFPV